MGVDVADARTVVRGNTAAVAEADGALAPLDKQPQSGRLLVVGMLTVECRELLTWTLAKLAQAGDNVLALHVALAPSAEVSRADVEAHKCQLMSKFCNVLAVYEGLCSLKQVDLQVRIVCGSNIRKTLVEEAKRHAGCTLVLGTNKLSPLGQATSFGKYCVKRLPPTWAVMVVERGKVLFNKQGMQPRNDSAGIDSSSSQPKSGGGSGVITSLHRSLRKVGSTRSGSAVHHHHPSDASAGGTKLYQSPAVLMKDHYQQQQQRLEDSAVDTSFSSGSVGSSFSGSSLSGSLRGCDAPHSPVSVLPSPRQRQRSFDAFRHSLSRKRADSAVLYSRSGYASILDSITTTAATAPSSPKPAAAAAQRVDDTARLLVDDNDVVVSQLHDLESEVAAEEETWTGVDDNKRFCFSPSDDRALCPALEDAEAAAVRREEGGDEFHVGWPLCSRAISTVANERQPQHDDGSDLDAARKLSVVRWALQLPSRPQQPNRTLYLQPLSEKLQPARLSLSSLPSEGDLTASVGWPGCRSLGDSGHIFSRLALTAAPSPATAQQQHMRRRSSWCCSLAQSLDLLCVDRKCRFFSPEELALATDNFSQANLVGKGGCSLVYRGVLPDGLVVAVKSLFQERAEAVQELLTEVEIVTSLRHPRVVALIGYCIDDDKLILVYNFAAGGNLEDNLHGDAVLEWSNRQKIALGTAAALEYLHDVCPRRVFHRDIKASNILLSADFEPQVSDFGLAKWAPEDASYITCSDVVGTFGYLAPEYFLYGRVDEKTDVYSFGVVLLELITGSQPIDSSKPKGQENLVSWATPLLDTAAVDQLVDPRLQGKYDASELSRMVFAASLCVRKSSDYRPKMTRILKILSGETDDLKVWLKREPTALPQEAEDDFLVPKQAKSDVETYMALAMLGVDDNEDAISEDFAHTNKSLVEYMNGRYSRSCSFD